MNESDARSRRTAPPPLPSVASVMQGQALRCTHCGQAMQRLALEGHYGNTQQADLCPRCHWVWFDDFESARLSGLGWISLLRHMHAAMAHTPGVIEATVGCPRCGADLQLVHNASRWGRTAGLECPRRHGQYRSFGQLLAERGLVRPLVSRDWRVLDDEGHALACLNCGAPVGGAVPRAPGEGPTARLRDTCAHCASPLLVFDLPRLVSSLSVRHGIELPREGAAPLAWPCRACGAPLDPTHDARCPQCAHAVLAPSLAELRPLLDEIEPRLRGVVAPAALPHGVRARAWRGHPATALYRYLRVYLGWPWWRGKDQLDAATLARIAALLAGVALIVWWLR